MQISFHIGANHTDEERLLKSLLKNANSFAEQGIKIPGPGRYRKLLRETMLNLQGAMPNPDTREILLDAIVDDDHSNRVVLSQSNFLGAGLGVLRGGEFFSLACEKITQLRALFPDDPLELHMGVRNPATFLPLLLNTAGSVDINELMQGLDPMAIKWSSLITRIRQEHPDVPLTVWSNEDTPLIWGQLIREISGVDPLTKIVGGFDLLSAIMTPEGMKRFVAYLKTHPPQTEVQKRRVIAAFLDKYALEEELEQEIDIPEWSGDYVDALTHQYEEDLLVIEQMPGVNFIAP